MSDMGLMSDSGLMSALTRGLLSLGQTTLVVLCDVYVDQWCLMSDMCLMSDTGLTSGLTMAWGHCGLSVLKSGVWHGSDVWHKSNVSPDHGATVSGPNTGWYLLISDVWHGSVWRRPNIWSDHGATVVYLCWRLMSHPEHRFPAPSSKLCQIWLRHWSGTLYLRAAVHWCSRHPLKGLGTDNAVEATKRLSTHVNMRCIHPG